MESNWGPWPPSEPASRDKRPAQPYRLQKANKSDGQWSRWASDIRHGLVAGDSAICGRLAALILRLRPAGLRFEEFRSPVKRGGLGLRFSNRSGLRPAAI